MTDPTQTLIGEKNRKAKEDANWKTIADVDWNDLEFFVAKARMTKDKDAFDTAIRVLTALKSQCLGKL